MWDKEVRKVEPVYTGEIVADDGTLVARVTKRLWVRKKEAAAGS